jgi:hypothetical protein
MSYIEFVVNIIVIISIETELGVLNAFRYLLEHLVTEFAQCVPYIIHLLLYNLY